jgi:hypothetical protein
MEARLFARDDEVGDLGVVFGYMKRALALAASAAVRSSSALYGNEGLRLELLEDEGWLIVK